MDIRESVRSDLVRRDPAYTLPRPFYSDADYHALDLEAIWYRKWLFIGHTCEVAKPGDYFTVVVGEYPIVVVRGADKQVRAFHNVCRHRGARICRQERGSAAKLVCPYHQWTYNHDGSLIYARDMGKPFDPSAHGLKPGACNVAAGYVFISLAETPEDFEGFRAAVEPYIAPHHLDDAKVAVESSIVERGNWKLVMENNRECYHCAACHPELARVYDDRPALNGTEDAGTEPMVAAHWAKCEGLGLPSRFRIADDCQWRVVRSPFLRDAASMTMSGEPAVKRPMTGVADPRLGSMMMFLYPNTWNHLVADHGVSFRVLPLGPRETLVTTKWLVHKDAVEGVDYDRETLTRVWTATNDQDRFLVEETQRGVDSPAYEPGPYAPAHEDGVVQFVDWYAHSMAEYLDGARRTLRSVG